METRELTDTHTLIWGNCCCLELCDRMKLTWFAHLINMLSKNKKTLCSFIHRWNVCCHDVKSCYRNLNKDYKTRLGPSHRNIVHLVGTSLRGKNKSNGSINPGISIWIPLCWIARLTTQRLVWSAEGIKR